MFTTIIEMIKLQRSQPGRKDDYLASSSKTEQYHQLSHASQDFSEDQFNAMELLRRYCGDYQNWIMKKIRRAKAWLEKLFSHIVSSPPSLQPIRIKTNRR